MVELKMKGNAMALHTRWSDEILKDENRETLNRWAEFVAYYMMFTGTQKIENADDFFFRISLWDLAVHGNLTYSREDLFPILEMFVGTTANVSQKTLHTFLTGDIKRIAKEKGRK
jgi:hypothetical protein